MSNVNCHNIIILSIKKLQFSLVLSWHHGLIINADNPLQGVTNMCVYDMSNDELISWF